MGHECRRWGGIAVNQTVCDSTFLGILFYFILFYFILFYFYFILFVHFRFDFHAMSVHRPF